MGKHIHKMLSLDIPAMRGVCANCGDVPIKKKPNGYRCRVSEMRWKNDRSRKDISYFIYKKDHCEECGFVPVHSCQLDVDHIDEDCTNNEPSNLQTLCANCHRLKSHGCQS